MFHKSLFLIVISILNLNLYAGRELKVNPSGETKLNLTSSSEGLQIKNSLAGLQTQEVMTPGGSFTELLIPDYFSSENTGCPKVPVMKKLIEIPAGADVKIQVLSSSYKDFDLQDLGYHPLLPVQPPAVKSEAFEIGFYIDSLAYRQNTFAPVQPATVEILGTLRGQRLARINLYPVQYNPVTQILRVFYELEVSVVFEHPDLEQTRANKQKGLNPFFHLPENLFLYSMPLESPQDTLTQYPVKYVIVADPMFQDALQPFIQWKEKKGFTVIEAYTNNPAVGTTTTSIKNYLQGLWNEGTPENPPPSFALFVGDVAQIPAFTGTTGSHPTDLFYCEYTNDHLPELFYGRFSATTVAQLQSQIDKTLEYEQYSMPDPSFLNECVMVAGMDASYGPTYANGQINYGTDTYFNTAHGLTSHTYLYPNSGSQAAQIRQNVSDGCCFANYTAHGSSSGWANPSFSTSHVPSLANAHKYPLMVGNACLTNKFNDPECFGESLLRASNKGAVGYIGASNNTYWDEDFYWAVGAKTVVVNPAYSATALGAYDRTFHDHGETYDEWFMTQDQMVFAGNLAVTQGSASMYNYYWEVYHLMGDPSLMIYYSQPPALSVTHASTLPLFATTFQVNTEAYAYAAVSSGGVLHGAAQADESGLANIPITAFTAPATADVVVTKQNHQPYFGSVMVSDQDTTPGVTIGNYIGCTDEFSLPVLVTGLTGFCSISLVINFNSTNLLFTGYSNVNPILSGGGLLVNQTGNTLVISWFSLLPVTISSGTLLNLNFFPLAAGSFPVTWDTTAPDNCQITDFNGDVLPILLTSGMVQITGSTAPASVSIVADPGTQVCEGSLVTFTAFSINGGMNPLYTWMINNTPVATGAAFATAALINGDVIQCELYSSSACSTGNPALSNILTMTVYPLPSVALGPDVTIPGDSTLILDAGAGYESYLWSTGETTQSITVSETGNYLVTVTNNEGCSGQDSIVVTVLSFDSFSGTLSYKNSVQTPLNNTLVQLKQGSSVLAETLTASNGYYQFSNLLPGTFQVNPVCTKTWGGVNATDALLIMKHFVGMTLLTGLNLKAADVDNSGVTNSLDALYAQKRSVGIISSFPAGDWAFIKPTVVFDGQSAPEVNLQSLTFGDVNGSFIPPSRITPTVNMICSGVMMVAPGNIFQVPITLEADLTLGAVSLYLKYPADAIRIVKIEKPGPSPELVYHVSQDFIRISWFNVEGQTFFKGDEIFMVSIELIDNEDFNTETLFVPDPESEFADPDGNRLTNLSLSIPELRVSPEEFSATAFPNPFTENILVRLHLPGTSMLKAEVYSPHGKKIWERKEECLSAGEHSFTWNGTLDNGTPVPSGIYYLNLSAGSGRINLKLIRIK